MQYFEHYSATYDNPRPRNVVSIKYASDDGHRLTWNLYNYSSRQYRPAVGLGHSRKREISENLSFEFSCPYSFGFNCGASCARPYLLHCQRILRSQFYDACSVASVMSRWMWSRLEFVRMRMFEGLLQNLLEET